ncbi:MAG: metal-dependent hydrolase, partial [Bacteroidota bacterium]
HSMLFAVVWSWLMVEIFCRFAERFSRSWWILWGYFAICTASHALLDAITNGGLGVAFFAPFENSRYFMPWRPVQVAPIGAANFFSEWGIRVIKSELIFIGIPCLVISAGGWLWRRVSSTK